MLKYGKSKMDEVYDEHFIALLAVRVVEGVRPRIDEHCSPGLARLLSRYSAISGLTCIQMLGSKS